MANSSTTSRGQDQNRNNPTLEKAKEAAFQAGDKAKEAASTVGEMVSHAASNVGKTADNLTSSAGAGIKTLGEKIGETTPHDGMLGTASQAVANTLKDGGKYLEEAGLSGVAKDVTELIRKNPVPAILVGMGIGFLIGRAMRS